MSEPKRHHYLPAFYLKRWSTHNDGMICQFTKNFGKLYPRRVHPDATGFEEYLYSLEGFPPKLAQQIETAFFSPVDNDAALALRLMERHGTSAPWTVNLRMAWATFIQTLLLRMPEDLAALKSKWRANMLEDNEHFENRYQQARSPRDPPTFVEYVQSLSVERWSRDIGQAFLHLLTHDNTRDFIAGMSWHVIDFPDTEHELLTSDRAVLWPVGLMEEAGHIGLPIGSRKLWLATHYGSKLDLGTLEKRELAIEKINEYLVGGAVKYVYGTNDRQFGFIEERFGLAPQRRLMDDIGHPRGRPPGAGKP